MRKVLFYCQYLRGIGHLARSFAIANELAKRFEVTFVQGGPPLPKHPDPSVRVVQLPPLLMREVDGANELYDPDGKLAPAEIFSLRRSVLDGLAHEGFDAVIVELFPFGRKPFGPEILHLIEGVKAVKPGAKVICSVRDILVEKEDAARRNAKIVGLINTHFDAVWVHSDPHLIRLVETFPEEEQIAGKITYTGFVAEPMRASSPRARSQKVLLSLGGGIVGSELYLAAAEIVADFPDLRFQFVLGPYTSPEVRSHLQTRLAEFSDRVEFSPLLPNFEDVLSDSVLSLSMAGYNTVMNLLNTRTPGLVLSFDVDHEQRKRASLFQDLGYLTLIEPADLTPERLRARIRERLASPYPEAVPDLRGAQKSLEALEKLLGQ